MVRSLDEKGPLQMAMQKTSFTMVEKYLTLKAISLRVNPGELVGIAGKVGSGKSSLLLVLLGEMDTLTSGDPHEQKL